MKTKIYLLLLAVLTFTACSDEDATTDVPVTELTLQKVEKFSPSLDLYTAGAAQSFKNVKYYSDNHIVADTTFNNAGAVTETQTYFYTGINLTTQYTYHTNGYLKYQFEYDLNNRLTDQKVYGANDSGIEQYIEHSISTYGDDNSITLKAMNPFDEDLVIPQTEITYLLNSEGFINSSSSYGYSTSILYQADKPAQYTHYGDGESIVLDYSFYTTPMPSNAASTTASFNNTILKGARYQPYIDLAQNCSYYVNKIQDNTGQLVTFDKTFNELNYVTYSKATGYMNQQVYDSESFYYYN